MSVTVYTRSSATGAWAERDVLVDQLQITDAVNERSTATVVLRDPSGTLLFERGYGVKIENDGTVLFAGFVEGASESRMGPDGYRTHTLACTDNHWLADKRVLVGAWTDTTAGDIVRDMVTDTLSDEGVGIGDVRDGASLRAFTANYRTVADVISDLAVRSGYWWRIDANRLLHFAPPSAFIALYAGDGSVLAGDDAVLAGASGETGATGTVDGNDVLADTLQVARHAGGYRNQQWIRGGYDRTDPQAEVFAGDGVRRTFTVAFPVSDQPSVEVDRGAGYAPETVGVAGFDQGTRQWYFSHRSHTITQDPADAPLEADDRLRVTYVGEFSVITRAAEASEVERVQQLDGGSGIVDHVLDDKTMTTREAALERSAQLLAYYARPAATVRFATHRTDLQPGQLVQVQLPEAHLDGDEALVTTVEWYTISGTLRAVVTLSIGPAEGSWAQFFLNLLARVDAATADVGQAVDVVTGTETFERDWQEADRPNIFTRYAPSASLYPGASLVPAFEFQDRVKYLAWFDGATEGGRRIITQQTGEDTDEITSVTVLGVNDAVGEWTHLAWVGGAAATESVGTGVVVTIIAYPFAKTNIEQLQVAMIDRKWS